MRRAARIDRNHPEVVYALERFGCSVVSLAALGKGAPDLLVGYRGKNFLLEVKDGQKEPARQRLNEKQLAWRAAWHGQVDTVHDVNEAIRIVLDGGA